MVICLSLRREWKAAVVLVDNNNNYNLLGIEYYEQSIVFIDH